MLTWHRKTRVLWNCWGGGRFPLCSLGLTTDGDYIRSKLQRNAYSHPSGLRWALQRGCRWLRAGGWLPTARGAPKSLLLPGLPTARGAPKSLLLPGLPTARGAPKSLLLPGLPTARGAPKSPPLPGLQSLQCCLRASGPE